MCTIMHAPTELERAMDMLIRVFQCYADRDSDRLSLSRRELSMILEAEFSELMKRGTHPRLPCEILQPDQDLDGKVDFEEFMSLTTKFIMCNHPYFEPPAPIFIGGSSH